MLVIKIAIKLAIELINLKNLLLELLVKSIIKLRNAKLLLFMSIIELANIKKSIIRTGKY